MRPDELLRALRRGDIDEVDSRDALALYDVFEGYALANETLRTALNALSERFHGPPSASGFTKAYLLSAEASTLVLDELSSILDNLPEELTPKRTDLTFEGFPAAAASAIRQHRPA